MAMVVQYLLTFTPYDNGLCSRDFECGWSLLGNSERSLLPFSIPSNLPEEHWTVQLMHNYAGLKLFMDRFEASKAEKLDAAINASRHSKNIMEGDHVFRKKPAFARPHKGTFPEKSCGPYVVTRKLGEAHVILQDPETGLMVDKGVPVPMDQIIIFPYRKPCTFLKGGRKPRGK